MVHALTGATDWRAGEIACGYADGGFTRAQCVLVAYHRGAACSGVAGGLMAAVALGAAEAHARLAKSGAAACVVACDNSPVSATLSGARQIALQRRTSLPISCPPQRA